MLRLHVFLAALLLFNSISHAEYVLSAPPRESAAEAVKIYGPLAAALTEILATPVTFQAAENWVDYGKSMREGKYDFVIDGPHFVGWRITNAQHTPLVSLPGQLSFWVAAQEGITSMDELRFTRVCGLPTPNLATLVLLSQFDPFKSPDVVTSRGGIKGVFNAFRENRCKAVVVRDLFVRNLPKEQAEKLNIIFRSQPFPEVTLTAGPRVPPEKHAAIVTALTGDADEMIKPILASLGGKQATALIPAKAETFVGFDSMLENNVWGWQARHSADQLNTDANHASR